MSRVTHLNESCRTSCCTGALDRPWLGFGDSLRGTWSQIFLRICRVLLGIPRVYGVLCSMADE